MTVQKIIIVGLLLFYSYGKVISGLHSPSMRPMSDKYELGLSFGSKISLATINSDRDYILDNHYGYVGGYEFYIGPSWYKDYGYRRTLPLLNEYNLLVGINIFENSSSTNGMVRFKEDIENREYDIARDVKFRQTYFVLNPNTRLNFSILPTNLFLAVGGKIGYQTNTEYVELMKTHSEEVARYIPEHYAVTITTKNKDISELVITNNKPANDKLLFALNLGIAYKILLMSDMDDDHPDLGLTYPTTPFIEFLLNAEYSNMRILSGEVSTGMFYGLSARLYFPNML